jgi:uncharacterized membrane protein YhaH (DUF805 family)
MTFAGAIKSVFTKYAVFKGTARRSEFWYFALFSLLLGIVAATLDSVIWPQDLSGDPLSTINQPTPIGSITSLILLVPSLSVTARRLHDAGWSGKWLLLYVLPILSLAFSLVALIAYTQSPDFGSAEGLVEVIAFLVPTLLIAFGVAVFLLILSVLPSKTRAEGNRYAPEV